MIRIKLCKRLCKRLHIFILPSIFCQHFLKKRCIGGPTVSPVVTHTHHHHGGELERRFGDQKAELACLIGNRRKRRILELCIGEVTPPESLRCGFPLSTLPTLLLRQLRRASFSRHRYRLPYSSFTMVFKNVHL